MSTFDDRYREFIEHYKPFIVSTLKEKYSKYCSEFESRYKASANFGGCIVIPLFVLCSISLIWFTRERGVATQIIVAVIFATVAIWFYRFFCGMLSNICDGIFERYEYRKVLLLCIEQIKNKELGTATTQLEIENIESFYRHCEHEITDEWFAYK